MDTSLPSLYVFKNGVLKDQEGRKFQLERAEISTGDDERLAVSVKLFALSKSEGKSGDEAGALLTVELGEREAYAFSEWLDRGVTQRWAK